MTSFLRGAPSPNKNPGSPPGCGLLVMLRLVKCVIRCPAGYRSWTGPLPPVYKWPAYRHIFWSKVVCWRYSSIPTNMLSWRSPSLTAWPDHQLEQWAAKWQMRFAPTKCFALSVTLHTNSSHFSYQLCDTGLDEVKYYKYLGVYITSSLSSRLLPNNNSRSPEGQKPKS